MKLIPHGQRALPSPAAQQLFQLKCRNGYCEYFRYQYIEYNLSIKWESGEILRGKITMTEVKVNCVTDMFGDDAGGVYLDWIVHSLYVSYLPCGLFLGPFSLFIFLSPATISASK